MVNHPPPFSKGQTLLWPFSYLPETPVLARVSRFVRKGSPLPAPSFSRVFRPPCSLFLRKPAFARNHYKSMGCARQFDPKLGKRRRHRGCLVRL